MTSTRTIALLIILCASAVAGCRPDDRSSARVVEPAAIDSTARALMVSEQVEGLAIAVIDSGQVRHVAAYGVRNAAREPLTTSTVMYGASLTKAAFAYFVLQLVDEQKLDLDATIASLLPKPLSDYEDYADLAGDERWRRLTPRMVLNHTTGFANFRWLEPDGKLRFRFDPGVRYGYSGEGFYILQLVLEEGLKLDVGAEMQRRLFTPLGMTRTSMQWRADFRPDLADGFGVDGTVEPHDERSRASAAGSMDTSIEDQARLWAAIVRGDGLTTGSRAEFARPQFAITSAHQFPTLDTTRGGYEAAAGLSAGLGVVTFRDASGPAWFKGGHNDWTGNMVICLEATKRCVVMLANDVRAERIFPELARVVLGGTAMHWAWEYSWFAATPDGD